MTANSYELRRCIKEKDLNPIHHIREMVLFSAQLTRVKYNRHHPDDQNPNHHNFLFLKNNKPIGTTRLDFIRPNEAAVRLVAILPNYQNQGNGTAMLNALESYAKEQGITKLVTNSATAAVKFYQAHGYVQQKWDDPGEGSSQATIQMIKLI